jgi:hypothetical protein
VRTKKLGVFLLAALFVFLLAAQVIKAGPWSCTLNCCGGQCTFNDETCHSGGCMHNPGYTYCVCDCDGVHTEFDCRV